MVALEGGVGPWRCCGGAPTWRSCASRVRRTWKRAHRRGVRERKGLPQTGGSLWCEKPGPVAGAGCAGRELPPLPARACVPSPSHPYLPFGSSFSLCGSPAIRRRRDGYSDRQRECNGGSSLLLKPTPPFSRTESFPPETPGALSLPTPRPMLSLDKEGEGKVTRARIPPPPLSPLISTEISTELAPGCGGEEGRGGAGGLRTRGWSMRSCRRSQLPCWRPSVAEDARRTYAANTARI